MGVFSRRRQAVVSPPVDDGLVRMMSRCRCSAAPVQKQAAWVGTQESKWACCSCGLVMPRDEVLQLMHGVYWRKLTGADEASAWARWLDTNRQQLQQASPWQLRFAEDVLAKCPGLVSDWVTIEHPFVDNQGQGRRIDFAVLPPGAIKLALEVDCLVPGLMETIKPRRIKNGSTAEVPRGTSGARDPDGAGRS